MMWVNRQGPKILDTLEIIFLFCFVYQPNFEVWNSPKSFGNMILIYLDTDTEFHINQDNYVHKSEEHEIRLTNEHS